MGIAKNKLKKSGYTIIETLVVISIFAVVSVIVTQIVATTLRNTRKSESVSIAKSEVAFAIETVEREIRGAKGLVNCGTDISSITYIATDSSTNTIACTTTGTVGSITKNGSPLTNSKVSVDCNPSVTSFVCSLSPIPNVSVKITASTVLPDGSSLGVLGGFASQSTKVVLRSTQ